ADARGRVWRQHRRRRHPRGGRRGVVPVRGPDRPDRQDGRAEALPGRGHLGRHPAQGRHAVLGEHRGDQQGRERPDLRVLRSGHRRRPQQDRPQAPRGDQGEEGRLIAVAGSSNGRVVPAEFPPPVDSRKEFIKREVDGEDERIEVGVAIVGGGTAGLACANRLLQLLGDDPETMERLGEVPVAVIEKAKTCGGHNLSGAVVRPGPLEELFPDLTREDWRKEGFAFGEVTKEAVYMTPNAKRSLRVPTPPPFKNHGNEVISVSALARYQQRMAEEGGAYILTETAMTSLPWFLNGGGVGTRSER